MIDTAKIAVSDGRGTAPGTVSLKHGSRISLDGRKFRFDRYVPAEHDRPEDADDLQFCDELTYRVRLISQQQFNDLYSVGKVRWLAAHDQPSDPELQGDGEDIGRSRRKLRWVQAYDADPVPKSDQQLQSFISRVGPQIGDDHPPSAGSLRRWITNRGEPGNRTLRHMRDRRRLRLARSGSRLSPVARDVLAEKAEQFWNDQKITPLDVFHRVTAAFVVINNTRGIQGLVPIKPPSKSTVWRYLKENTDYARFRNRFGLQKAERIYKPLMGSLTAKRILEIAILDHTVVDTWVVDDEGNFPIGRPCLAVLIDAKSRYPLAIHVSFEPPSLHTALACLRKAVRPKCYVKERFPGIVGEWVAYGVPETILCDNAWEATGVSFHDACADAGISIVYAPVRRPQYKGIVERFFGTLNKMLFHKLPGAVPGKPDALKDLGIEPAKEAVLRLSELEELIHKCIIEVYGREPHRGIEAVPEHVWCTEAEQHGIRYHPDLLSLDMALAKTSRDKTLSREGITHNGLTYRADAVFNLLEDLLPLEKVRGRRAGTVKVKIKYHPEDLGQIFVWNEKRRLYVPLPCIDPDAYGLSEFRHSRIKEFAAEQGIPVETKEGRSIARVRLAAAIEAHMPRASSRNRRRAERLKNPSAMIVAGERVDFKVRETAPARTVNTGRRVVEIPIETVGNRQDGNSPEKTRWRGGRKRGRASVQRSAPPFTPAVIERPQNAESRSPHNPLADFDVERLIGEARTATEGRA